MSILINVLLALWVLVALLMVLVILMQRPKSEGLGAAFGGGVTENLFGAQTTNVLVKFTGWLAGIFFVLTFALSILYARRGAGDTALRRELLKQQTAGATSPTQTPAAPAGAVPPATPSSPATAPANAASSPAQQPPPPQTSSPAPDSGAGVLPAGSVSPVPTSTSPPPP